MQLCSILNIGQTNNFPSPSARAAFDICFALALELLVLKGKQ